MSSPYANLHISEITELLNQAPTYVKTAIIKAEQVKVTTRVETIINGMLETTNTAHPGDYIITNPSGEKYVLSSEKFATRYLPSESPGMYKAVGEIKAIKNPFGKAITIIAPWGEEQHGDSNCYIAMTDKTTDRYIIEAQAFQDTYGLKTN